jgi:hypothetical protein
MTGSTRRVPLERPLLYWSEDAGRQQTFFLERLSPRRRPRHSRNQRRSRLQKRCRPRNRSRPSHRRGQVAPQPRPRPRKFHLHPRSSRAPHDLPAAHSPLRCKEHGRSSAPSWPSARQPSPKPKSPPPARGVVRVTRGSPPARPTRGIRSGDYDLAFGFPNLNLLSSFFRGPRSCANRA